MDWISSIEVAIEGSAKWIARIIEKGRKKEPREIRMERILGVRLELRQLTAQVLCELPEIVDHEVDLRLLMREADQPLFIKSWRTHDVVVDRPEE